MKPMKFALLISIIPALAFGAVCVGGDPCKACRDCSDCKYCDPKNPKGGSCGVLRDQTPAQRAAAQKKRGGNTSRR